MTKLIVRMDDIEKEIDIDSFKPDMDDLVKEEFGPDIWWMYVQLVEERRKELALWIGTSVLNTIERLNSENE